MKIQGKLENMPGSTQYDIINSLLLYIRQAVIRARVEDAQLGVESYQTQLNFTAPKTRFPNLQKNSLYKFIKKPFGVVYSKDNDNLRVMDYTEVHKFGDQTLKFVGIKLTDKLRRYKEGLRVGWNNQDAKEARKFISRIEAKLRFREQIRSLERLIGGREPIPNILTYRRPYHTSFF